MKNKDLEVRRYNASTVKTEVAAIFVGYNGEPPSNRDVCTYLIGDSCKNISFMNQCCDPMIYSLLFPHGELGWHSSMENAEDRRSSKQ